MRRVCLWWQLRSDGFLSTVSSPRVIKVNIEPVLSASNSCIFIYRAPPTAAFSAKQRIAYLSQLIADQTVLAVTQRTFSYLLQRFRSSLMLWQSKCSSTYYNHIVWIVWDFSGGRRDDPSLPSLAPISTTSLFKTNCSFSVVKLFFCEWCCYLSTECVAQQLPQDKAASTPKRARVTITTTGQQAVSEPATLCRTNRVTKETWIPTVVYCLV